MNSGRTPGTRPRPDQLPNPLADVVNQNPCFQRGKATVLVVVGGCAAALAHASEVVADAVIYLDNATEVAQVRPDSGVVALAVARGTIGELLDDLPVPESVRKYLGSLPAANKLNDGAGQWRKLGLLAGMQLLREGVLDELFVKVFEYLLILHGGELTEVEGVVIASQAGGVGAGLAVTVAEAAERVMVSRTPVPVTIVLCRVGAASYTGCGPRVEFNCAATLPEDLEWYAGARRHPRATRKVLLTELPPAGTKKPARDRCAAALGQAVRSTIVQVELALSLINWALHSALSGITLVKPGFWCQLPAGRIGADVARTLAPRIAALIGTRPDPELVRDVAVTVGREDDHLPRIAELARTATACDVKPAHFDDEIRRPARYGGSVRVRLAGETGVYSARPRTDTNDQDGTLEAFLSGPILTEAACRGRLQTLGGLAERVAAEAETRRQALPGLKRAAAAADQALAATVERLWPATWPSWLLQFFLARPDRVAAFESAVARRREAADKVDRLTFELTLLDYVAGVVRGARDAILARLGHLIAFGERHVGDLPGAAALVTTGADLDGVLGRLAAVDQLTDEAVADVLSAAVESITLAGLAEIVGASSARPEAVVRAIQDGPVLTAPWYGGGLEPADAGMRLTVLPKVGGDVLERLDAAAQALGVGLTLVAAESVGGFSVTRLDIRPATRVKELFTPRLLHALAAVRENPDLWLAPDTTVDFQRFPTYGIDVDRLGTSLNVAAQEAA